MRKKIECAMRRGTRLRGRTREKYEIFTSTKEKRRREEVGENRDEDNGDERRKGVKKNFKNRAKERNK